MSQRQKAGLGAKGGKAPLWKTSRGGALRDDERGIQIMIKGLECPSIKNFRDYNDGSEVGKEGWVQPQEFWE